MKTKNELKTTKLRGANHKARFIALEPKSRLLRYVRVLNESTQTWTGKVLIFPIHRFAFFVRFSLCCFGVRSTTKHSVRVAVLSFFSFSRSNWENVWKMCDRERAWSNSVCCSPLAASAWMLRRGNGCCCVFVCDLLMPISVFSFCFLLAAVGTKHCFNCFSRSLGCCALRAHPKLLRTNASMVCVVKRIQSKSDFDIHLAFICVRFASVALFCVAAMPLSSPFPLKLCVPLPVYVHRNGARRQ